jgi:predicted O-methyltransferase YrrM
MKSRSFLEMAMLDDLYEQANNGAASVRFGDVELYILLQHTNAENLPSGENIFFMAKSSPYIAGYRDISARLNVKNLLEIGIYKGGSVVFFDNAFELDQLSAIDIRHDRVHKLDSYIEKHGNSKQISLHYGVDQGDRATLRDLIDKDFPAGIDLVIDDASHFYGPSKASFETVFPRLKPGGVYVIEDWSWSHSDPSAGGDNEDATRLLHEIIALHASSSGMASSIDLRPGFFSVTRGAKPIPDNFQLEDYALKHRVSAAQGKASAVKSVIRRAARRVLRPLRALGSQFRP